MFFLASLVLFSGLVPIVPLLSYGKVMGESAGLYQKLYQGDIILAVRGGQAVQDTVFIGAGYGGEPHARKLWKQETVGPCAVCIPACKIVVAYRPGGLAMQKAPE